MNRKLDAVVRVLNDVRIDENTPTAQLERIARRILKAIDEQDRNPRRPSCP